MTNRCWVSPLHDRGDEGLPFCATAVARLERLLVSLMGVEVVDAAT